MTKPELTNRRDLTYNIWHRKLGNKIYALDIDLMEYDNQGNPLALIETKKWGYSISDFQKMCFIKTAELLGVPFFLCSIYTRFN